MAKRRTRRSRTRRSRAAKSIAETRMDMQKIGKGAGEIAEATIGRPPGVLAVSALSWLSAFLSIVTGMSILTIGFIGSFIPTIGIAVSFLGAAVGGLLIVLGIGIGIVTYWFYNLQTRGWTGLAIITIANIAVSVIGGNWIAVGLSVIVLGYMWSRRRYFNTKFS